MDIFDRLNSGEAVPFNDPQYSTIFEIVSRTMKLSAELNSSADMEQMRRLLSEITGTQIDASTTILAPFQINLGVFT